MAFNLADYLKLLAKTYGAVGLNLLFYEFKKTHVNSSYNFLYQFLNILTIFVFY